MPHIGLGLIHKTIWVLVFIYLAVGDRRGRCLELEDLRVCSQNGLVITFIQSTANCPSVPVANNSVSAHDDFEFVPQICQFQTWSQY